MSNNRLFLYDQKSQLAFCIAKGYPDRWGAGHADFETEDDFFYQVSKQYDGTDGPTDGIGNLKLCTELDLPEEATVLWPSERKPK